jgi:hypothetical protein
MALIGTAAGYKEKANKAAQRMRLRRLAEICVRHHSRIIFMSAWNKDLSGYIWPWLEPVLGVFLVFGGAKTIIKHEFHDHSFAYRGAVADFAGVLMLLGAFLLFRGRVWRNRGWVNWTVLDKMVGVIVGLGIMYFIAMRFVSII